MTGGRDDFPRHVITALAERVGRVCSNPDCYAPTSGPQEDPAKAVNVGVAAHITAASPGGPRYEETLTSDQRSAVENGIWLCQNCAKLVDNDPIRFHAVLLHQWKIQAEEQARNLIGKTKLAAITTSSSQDAPYRPWLFITSADVEPSTGRIRVFIQNKGKTPAYQIKIEDWSEVSKPMQRCATVVPVPEGFDPDNVTFFEKAYDTRQSVLPDYGGASASARMDMLLPETEPIEYLLTDHTERLIKALKLDRVQVRHVGKVSYTDARGELKPDCRFCYQTLTLKVKDQVRRILLPCPDVDTNVSR